MRWFATVYLFIYISVQCFNAISTYDHGKETKTDNMAQQKGRDKGTYEFVRWKAS